MNTKILENFGKAIKNVRLEKGLTQEFLAEKVGIHPTYVGKLESGKNNPSLKMIFKLSRALGISLCELFSFDKLLTSIK